uniref:Cytochrome c oxidase subunit 3 n=1 Tax=Lens contradens TaxID=2771348 RepID=A0A8A3WMC1_9BIVA|nr:cytochrome c oxidase subunit 3 [Lens contradens]
MRSPFHVVEQSPWPFFSSVSSVCVMIGLVSWFNDYSLWFLSFSLVLLLLVLFQWWRDVIREGNQGWHTDRVAKNIRFSMMLFILSEVMFFVSFFWAFFSCSLVPGIEIGGVWPPVGIVPVNPFKLPLLNTAVLLGSGVSVTWAHYSVMAGNRWEGIMSLSITVLLGVYFSVLQILEYYECSFSISDSVYGSLFYVMTGFHGLHVVIGTLMLVVCLFRCFNYGFSVSRHIGLEVSIWYWHFVDVVWIFLFLCVYWWGS